MLDIAACARNGSAMTYTRKLVSLSLFLSESVMLFYMQHDVVSASRSNRHIFLFYEDALHRKALQRMSNQQARALSQSLIHIFSSSPCLYCVTYPIWKNEGRYTERFTL